MYLCDPALTGAAPAASATEPYADTFVDQCCYQKIESGAIIPQYFTVMNTGSVTWGEPGDFSMNLGTDGPRERTSAFRAPNWPTPNRPVVGVSHPVAPGADYKFVFDVQAPTVTIPTTFQETFSVLAENDQWLDNQSGLGSTMWLEYEVLPASPPTVSISLAQPSVTAGQALSVSASATAVASLNHTTIQFAGQQVTGGPLRNPEIADDEQASWTQPATFSTAGLVGLQTVVATAYDDAGLSTTQTAVVDVVSPPPPPPPPKVTVARYRVTMLLTEPKSRRQLRTRQLALASLPTSSTVSYTCAGCAGRHRSGSRQAHSSRLTIPTGLLVMSSRSRLTITVTAADGSSRSRTYEFRPRSHSEPDPFSEACRLTGGASAPCP